MSNKNVSAVQKNHKKFKIAKKRQKLLKKWRKSIRVINPTCLVYLSTRENIQKFKGNDKFINLNWRQQVNSGF